MTAKDVYIELKHRVNLSYYLPPDKIKLLDDHFDSLNKSSTRKSNDVNPRIKR